MKKTLPFLLLLLSLGARSQTSVYHPFPDPSTLWNFDRNSFVNSFYNMNIILFKYSPSPDKYSPSPDFKVGARGPKQFSY